MNLIGKKVDGKYEILTSIGKGGMSEVFLARDNRLNQQWAVKVVQKNARNENNESVVQSALIEANLIKQFDHPSIVRIVDIIEDELPDIPEEPKTKRGEVWKLGAHRVMCGDSTNPVDMRVLGRQGRNGITC